MQQEKTERNQQMLECRENGMTYREIGEKFGVSAGQARIVCLNTERKNSIREEGSIEQLPVLAKNVLLAKNITTKEEARRELVDGILSTPQQRKAIPNLGNKTYQQILEWVGYESWPARPYRFRVMDEIKRLASIQDDQPERSRAEAIDVLCGYLEYANHPEIAKALKEIDW